MQSKPEDVQTSMNQKLCTTPDWSNKPYNKRNIWECLASINVISDKCYTLQLQNQNPPPIHNIWILRVFLTLGIAPTLAIHALWYHCVPTSYSFHTWHPVAAYIFYYWSFTMFTVFTIRHLHYYMDFYGTFDEHERSRDHLSDKMVTRVVKALIIRTLIRISIAFIFGRYNRSVPPVLGHTISWLFLVKIGIWLIAVDFFFYCYHRAAHTVPLLWKIHSTHHSIKQPTPIQMDVATDVQSLLEHCLIPVAASLIIPLSVYEHYIAQCVLLAAELGGHSGIRAYWVHPILYEVLRPFKMEICVEDHDLHHRYGKSGLNYGKQTRIFDRLFGSICERLECVQK